MSDVIESIENYPLKLVDLMVKTNNFDTTLNLLIDGKTKQFDIKFVRSDDKMGKNLTLTIATDRIYTKFLIPNNKSAMVDLVASVLGYLKTFHTIKTEIRKNE